MPKRQTITAWLLSIAVLAAPAMAQTRYQYDDDQPVTQNPVVFNLDDEGADAPSVFRQASHGDGIDCESPADCTAPVDCTTPVSEGCSCSDCTSAGGCGCAAKKKPNPCAKSHKGVFYANDFSYLNDPNYCGCCFGDQFKLMPVGECGQWGTVDVGGQFRLRYHHEEGMGQRAGATRFQDTTNDFMLSRLRLYTNWEINDWARFYAEGIYAGVTSNSAYVPRGIDENNADFLNLFFDVKMTDSLTVRLGRQELLYGAQRTVSPLDWANTRRTFEGIKGIYKQGDLTVDAFYTNFVPVSANQFDEADYDQSFYGFYSTYNGFCDASMDFYYLGYDDERPTSDFSIHTLGARLKGNVGEWLYEFEGAPQFGRQSALGADHSAGFYTAGLGRKVSCLPWDTTVWAYYDYASGHNGNGDFNRYNQLFPLAHKYLGFIDAAQRSNIEAPNLFMTMKPTKKLSLLMWYYHFIANQDTDIVPSIGGTPAQNGSQDWGDELDLVATYNIGPRQKLLFGWSHFWAGNKIAAPGRQDADFVYTEWTMNF